MIKLKDKNPDEDTKRMDQNLKFAISDNQEIIEYSPSAFNYLNNICEIIKNKNGGILIIDYGYLEPKMHETLQAINNHKYSNVLENIGDSDITYNISFNLFEKFIARFHELDTIFNSQKLVPHTPKSPDHNVLCHVQLLSRQQDQTEAVYFPLIQQVCQKNLIVIMFELF